MMAGQPGRITLARLRADVAALLHEAPEDIGLDDNIFDLGLDSMRLMSLTLQWKEEAIPLDFAALAERDTLAGWWEVISARLSEEEKGIWIAEAGDAASGPEIGVTTAGGAGSTDTGTIETGADETESGDAGGGRSAGTLAERSAVEAAFAPPAD